MKLLYIITFSALLIAELTPSLTAMEENFSFKQARARKIAMDQNKAQAGPGFKKTKPNRNLFGRNYEFLNFSNYHVNWQRFFKVQNRGM